MCRKGERKHAGEGERKARKDNGLVDGRGTVTQIDMKND